MSLKDSYVPIYIETLQKLDLTKENTIFLLQANRSIMAQMQSEGLQVSSEYIDMRRALKAELATRPHLPSKQERAAIRKAKQLAKQNR